MSSLVKGTPTLNDGDEGNLNPGAEEEDEDEQNRIRIRWISLRQIKRDRRYVILGKTGCGKSVLMDDLLSKMFFSYDHAFGMATTAGGLNILSKYISASCIFDTFDTDKLVQIIETMVMITNKLRPRGAKRLILIALDDCQAEEKGFKHPVFQRISMNGRHYGIAMLFVAQYVMKIPKFLRQQIDYVFSLGTDNPETLPQLKQFYGAMTTPEFYAAMETFTQQFGILVADHTAKNIPSTPVANPHKYNVENQVFFYRAEPDKIKPHKMGNRDHWKLHHRFYRPPSLTLTDFPIPSLAPKAQEAKKRKSRPSGMQEAVVHTGKSGKRGASSKSSTGQHSSSSSAKPSTMGGGRKQNLKFGDGYDVTILERVDKEESAAMARAQFRPSTVSTPPVAGSSRHNR